MSSINLPFSIHPRILDNLQVIVNNTDKTNDDGVILIVGEPGSGKSTLASQIKYALDKMRFKAKFEYCDIKELYFSSFKYEKYARANNRKNLVMDESYRAMSSKRSTSETNFSFGTMLREVRENNHIHIFLMQDLWDFEKNIIFQRADLVIYAYKLPDYNSKIMKKGFFKMYGLKKIKRLYINGYKYHDMDAYAFDDGRGTFPPDFMFNPKEYKKAKQEFIAQTKKEQEESEKEKNSKKHNMLKFITGSFIERLESKTNKRAEAIKTVLTFYNENGFDINLRTLQRWYKEYEESQQ